MQVEINGFTAFYQDDDFSDPWRPRETVMLQHGYCRNGNFYRAWVPHLARERRVVRMDMRGMGRSSDPGPDYAYSLDGLAADAIAFLDALGIERVHYVGESLGALTGVAAAATYPERFASLTLVGAPLAIQPRTSTAMATGYPTWVEAIETLGMHGHWLETRKALNEFSDDPPKNAYFAGEFARTPVHVATALARVIPGASIAEYAPRVTAPVLLIAPAQSTHTDAAQQSELERLMPHAQLWVYPAPYHGIYYLNPDDLAERTQAFLREVSEAAAARA